MGILRSDRVSGLGGANAINGSVKFGDSYLRIPYSTPDDFTFDGNFTVEYWYYPQSIGADGIHVEYSRPTGYKRAWQVYQDHSSNTYAPKFWWWAGGSTTGSMTSSITMTPNNWYHIAWVRIGTTLYNYVDGVSGGSSTGTSGITLGDPSDAEKPFNSLNIGVQIYNGPQLMLGGGHISNLRIIKGEGIYTAAFTPPTTRLEKTSNTVLLCCQSPGDVTKEETGKIIETNNIANSAPPQASTFAPDLGEDHGTTFADGAVFDTLSYMVPPKGTTTQSNRGRGLIIAGYTNPLNIKTTDYVQIQSLGNAIKFGDATALVRGQDAAGSSTRAVSAGGYVAPGIVDTIEYFTTATTSNAVDFGNLVSATSSLAGFGNETRGIWAGGYVPSASDKIDYVTIATTGNASDFGNCVANVATAAGCASPTRGVFGGGYASPAGNNTLQYVTIATTGNATDFGDLTAVTWGLHAFSSNTRGVFGGGVAPSITNTISYVTIASTGNAVDFGDLIQAAAYHACTSNGSRGIFAGGDPTSTFLNTIQYVTISTTGNSSDFGDMTTIGAYRAATSDSHGGLS